MEVGEREVGDRHFHLDVPGFSGPKIDTLEGAQALNRLDHRTLPLMGIELGDIGSFTIANVAQVKRYVDGSGCFERLG